MWAGLKGCDAGEEGVGMGREGCGVGGVRGLLLDGDAWWARIWYAELWSELQSPSSYCSPSNSCQLWGREDSLQCVSCSLWQHRTWINNKGNIYQKEKEEEMKKNAPRNWVSLSGCGRCLPSLMSTVQLPGCHHEAAAACFKDCQLHWRRVWRGWVCSHRHGADTDHASVAVFTGLRGRPIIRLAFNQSSC